MKLKHIQPSKHPLYTIERHRVHWANPPQDVKRKLCVVTIVTAALISIIGLLAFGYTFNRQYYSPQADSDMFAILFVSSLTIVTFFSDSGAFLVNLSSIADDKVRLRWDLLVLALEKDAYIRTKHQIAMLRIGRVLWFNRVLRTTIVIIFILWAFFSGYFIDYNPTVADIVEDIRNYPVPPTLSLLILTTLALVYLFEPVWRTRAVTAMAVAISAYTRHMILAVPLAFFLMVFMWGILFVLLGLITFVAVQIAVNLIDYFYAIDLNYNEPIRLAIEFSGITIYVLTLIAAGYTYYRLLVTLSYKLIRRRIP